MLNSWNHVLSPPINCRSKKPRKYGLTMVQDQGCPVRATKEWLSLTKNYVDLIKLSFGTSALYPEKILVEKVNLLRAEGIGVFPGGTLLETAVFQGKARDFLSKAWDFGFNFLEISDGTVSMNLRTRGRIIEVGKALGFSILSEIGKKHAEDCYNTPLMLQTAKFDLDHGVDLVMVEGNKLGTGVGLYDKYGVCEEYRVEFLVENLPWEKLLWKTPHRSQQVELIKRFGSNVNLGNIPPAEVYPLECLRLGLRGETLLSALKTEEKDLPEKDLAGDEII